MKPGQRYERESLVSSHPSADSAVGTEVPGVVASHAAMRAHLTLPAVHSRVTGVARERTHTALGVVPYAPRHSLTVGTLGRCVSLFARKPCTRAVLESKGGGLCHPQTRGGMKATQTISFRHTTCVNLWRGETVAGPVRVRCSKARCKVLESKKGGGAGTVSDFGARNRDLVAFAPHLQRPHHDFAGWVW